MTKTNKVTLREEHNETNYRFLGAQIKTNNDLVFEGQDIGSEVDSALGFKEYEWFWTIKANDVALLNKAIGGGGDNIITSLKKHFSDDNAAKLYKFMQDNDIPFESWSRVGD